MTIPMTIGIMAMILFQATDRYFVSRLGTEALVAFNFTTPITMLLMNLCIGLSIATSVQVGRAIGEKNQRLAQRLTTETMIIGLLLVTILSATGLVFIEPIFQSVGASAHNMPLIREYMDVFFVSFGLMVIPMLSNGVIRATGDTKWPSYMMMASGCINILLDWLLIFGKGPFPEMGIAGAAWATAISWSVSFIGSIYILRAREKLLLLFFPPLQELIHFAAKMMRTAVPISIANMITPIIYGVLLRMVDQYGDKAVAGFGAGAQIENFAIVLALALTSTLSPFMAQNIGANNVPRAHQAYWLSQKFIVSFQIALAAIIFLASPWLATLFSNDPIVVEYTLYYLRIMPIGICGFVILIVSNTAFNAADHADYSLFCSLIRLFICVVPIAYIGSELYGMIGLMVGSCIGNFLSGAISAYMVHRLYTNKLTSITKP